MPDTMTPSSLGSTPGGHEVPRQVLSSRRRDKVQLSCNLCRRRKLKCDRNQPCETCTKRGLSLSCSYVHANTTNQDTPSGRPSPSIEGKIHELESLVVSLRSKFDSSKQSGEAQDIDISCETQTSQTSQTPPIRDDTMIDDSGGHHLPLSDMFGRISLDNRETSYVCSAHWTAILDGIAELKDHFEETDGHYPAEPEMEEQLQQPPKERLILLFGLNTHATRDEIFASIPSRCVVDRLVSSYFGAMDMAPVVIHGPTFLREYERFWNDPPAMPIMWVGMLLAMMCLATRFQTYQADERRDPGIYLHSLGQGQSTVHYLQEKIVQCLVLGDYTKPGPYTVQALLLYFTTEHFQSEDTRLGTWVLLGMIVRIAMRMGYHCDASHSSRITSFEGEMRRRAWAMLVQLDLVTSSQIGLPRMIKESEYDAAEPRNLFDSDFDEGTVSLPVPRPDTDLTPMLYVIVRNRITSVLGKISDLTNSTLPDVYTEVMALDDALHEVRNAIPSTLQTRSMTTSLLDSPEIVMQRAYIALSILKGRCVLHRRHLVLAYTNSRYSFSRQSCVDAALAILQIQSTLNLETQPGGRLYQTKWKISSLVNHDFLLATTILCLDLDRGMAVESQSFPSVFTGDEDRRQTIVQALHESYRIWLQSSHTSREAQKATQALEIMLGKEHSLQAIETHLEDDVSLRTAVKGNNVHHGPLVAQTHCTHNPLSQCHNIPETIANSQASTFVPPNASIPSSIEAADGNSSNDMLSGNSWGHWDPQFQNSDYETLFGFGNDQTQFGSLYQL